jgi:hypothetical protein
MVIYASKMNTASDRYKTFCFQEISKERLGIDFGIIILK